MAGEYLKRGGEETEGKENYIVRNFAIFIFNGYYLWIGPG
jgi:hypothetical protein